MQDQRAQIEELARRFREASFALVFTGAGLSTGSGIPDFRGPNGIWKKWKPVYYQDFLSSHDARVRHWEYKLSGWQGFREAEPNAGHRAIARLQEWNRVQAVITQNIDGLHQKAGSPDAEVIELHGTNLAVECTQCGKTFPPDRVYEEFEQSKNPPVCEECEGFLKPATISFGQQMPQEKLNRAFSLAERADLALSVGSTLEVQPAASVPLAAKQRGGAFYAVVNLGETAHDEVADLRIERDAGETLSALVEILRSSQ